MDQSEHIYPHIQFFRNVGVYNCADNTKEKALLSQPSHIPFLYEIKKKLHVRVGVSVALQTDNIQSQNYFYSTKHLIFFSLTFLFFLRAQLHLVHIYRSIFTQAALVK